MKGVYRALTFLLTAFLSTALIVGPWWVCSITGGLIGLFATMGWDEKKS